MASSHRALPVAALFLRVLALLLLAASIAILATAKIHARNPFSGKPDNTFKDFYAYKYVTTVCVIGCAYSVVAIPFEAINVAARKKTSTVFLICVDVVLAVLIATGGAAGLGLTVETQRRFDEVLDSSFKTFFNRVDTSCATLLLASLCLVVIIMLSAYSLTK